MPMHLFHTGANELKTRGVSDELRSSLGLLGEMIAQEWDVVDVYRCRGLCAGLQTYCREASRR